ncbi:NAD(+) kinase [candidate division KSB1 bacterium]|nr:MAG: NAD(+) kinase [candidate division KSB1 bacterium]
MKFGIFANTEKSGLQETLNALIEWVKRNNSEVLAPETMKSFITKKLTFINLLNIETIVKESDIIISLGGDGTMLGAAEIIGIDDTPVMGINLGGLGFLTQASVENMFDRLDKIKKGEYKIEKRMMLEADVIYPSERKSFFALNDVVFNRAGNPRMMKTEVYVDDTYFNTYVSDGLIISTPTGSTAYSLSAGGPIVVPGLEAIILNPICPHAVTVRPTIIPSESVIDITVAQDDLEPFVSIDGQRNIFFTNNSRVTIKKADRHISLVTFEECGFFKILREKLQWGRLPHK